MVESFGRGVIRLRWLIVLLSVLLVAGLGSGGRFLEFTNDYRVFFSEGNPQLKAFENLQDTYTRNDNVMVMLLPKSGKVFEPETLEAVIDLTERSWQIPYSVRVDSVSNFQHTFSEEDDLVVLDLVENPSELPAEELARLEQIAIDEPLLVHRLIAPDGGATAVNVTIELPGVDEMGETPEVITHVRGMLAEVEAAYPDIEFYTTGVVMMNNAFPEASKNDMSTLIPLVYVAIIIGMILFLRTFSGTVATVLVILFSIVSAMGIAGWMGIKLTPPSASAPTMIMTLAVADSIHFLASMLFGMRHGKTRHEAIVESLRINFQPIFLTSLTTAIGFLSMNFSDAPPFRDLGNITAMGVVLAFVFSVTFLPALMAILPVKVKQAEEGDSTVMDKLANFVIRRQKVLLYGMGGLILLFAALVPTNKLNDVFVEYFDESVEFRAHTDKITENLTGMYFIDYSLESGESGGLSEPEFLAKVDAFADWYREQPEVMHVSVIADTFKRLNKNMHSDEESWYKLPDARNMAAQYLLLYEMSLPYGLDLNNQLNVDKSATRVSVSIDSLSTTDTLILEDRAVQWLTDNAPELVTQGASPTIMFSHIGMRNIRSMLTGTTIALVLISVVLVFALRSLKMGLISLVPNLAPAAVAFGVWALTVGEVGLALSVVAAMTLGIVVDDTVHFLSKYLRARRERNLSAEEAVRYAFRSVGWALTVTTGVLGAGFMVLAQSVFELNSGMGLLTAITITIALIIDFLFLPPLLLLLDGEKKKEPVSKPEKAQAV